MEPKLNSKLHASKEDCSKWQLIFWLYKAGKEDEIYIYTQENAKLNKINPLIIKLSGKNLSFFQLFNRKFSLNAKTQS